MLIANPIYDVVFKYLMDDNKVAKMIISAIIDEEIESLEYLPQEQIVEMKHHSFTVYRMDFSARIKTEDGSFKQVIIEIQKAKFPTDIMRFRKYLGKQYSNEENTICVKEPTAEYKTKALPLISIYFLGHKLTHTTAPVIRVKRKYIDAINGNEIKEKEEFIESLTHDSYVIQIPYLSKRRRNELEIMLSVFNQDNTTSDSHIINVKENDFPEKYHPIIRRLIRANAEDNMRNTMEVEDEIVGELKRRERIIADKDETIEERNKTLKEKNKTLKKKDETLKKKDITIANKDKQIEELKKKLESL